MLNNLFSNLPNSNYLFVAAWFPFYNICVALHLAFVVVVGYFTLCIAGLLSSLLRSDALLLRRFRCFLRQNIVGVPGLFFPVPLSMPPPVMRVGTP